MLKPLLNYFLRFFRPNSLKLEETAKQSPSINPINKRETHIVNKKETVLTDGMVQSKKTSKPLKKKVKRKVEKVAKKKNDYEFLRVDDIPEQFENKLIYIVGDAGFEWLAAFKCPCNCNEIIKLSLLKDSKPKWNIKFNYNNTITINPSIDRFVGCRSHFNIEKNCVLWWNTNLKNYTTWL